MKFPFDQKIRLENDRVLLESFSVVDDAEVLRSIAVGHADLLLYSPSDFHTDDLFDKYILGAVRQRLKYERCIFRIYDKKFKAYAGSTSFGNISDQHERLEIGWTWIAKAHQRTGLNRNMKLLLLDFAFDEIGAKRVELKSDARNMQSRAAMEGIGASYEGCLKSHTVMSDGFRRDTVYYGMTVGEWPTIRAQLKQKIV